VSICDGEFAGPAACTCGHWERHVDISDEMVDRAARAIAGRAVAGPANFWEEMDEEARTEFREDARVALAAALKKDQNHPPEDQR
jgi:hypothetical protein